MEHINRCKKSQIIKNKKSSLKVNSKKQRPLSHLCPKKLTPKSHPKPNGEKKTTEKKNKKSARSGAPVFRTPKNSSVSLSESNDICSGRYCSRVHRSLEAATESLMSLRNTVLLAFLGGMNGFF